MDMPNTVAPDRAQGEIPGELDQLAASLAYVVDRLETLSARLSPVLRSHEPSPALESPKEAKLPTRTAWGERIRAQQDVAIELATVINDLVDRIEV